MSRTIAQLLKLNSSRRMQLALNEDKEGKIVENNSLAVIDSYTFIRQRADDYCVITINPINEETTDVSVPSIAISDEVKAIFTVGADMTNVTNEPKFKRNGADCTFLGHFNNHDLYYSDQAGLPTVIARYGNDGDQYTSGMTFVGTVPELTKAHELAKERGLITP